MKTLVTDEQLSRLEASLKEMFDGYILLIPLQSPDNPPHLAGGQMWQALTDQSARQLAGALLSLLEQMAQEGLPGFTIAILDQSRKPGPVQ